MTTNTNIQNIINNAEAGDTILFTGLQYGHIHLSINKPLNIISTVGTQIYACPMASPTGADNFAAFAIYNGASGTNISGFKINNNQEGYGIAINNTSQINVYNNKIACKNGTGIKVIDSDEINLKNNSLFGSNTGIKLLNSSSTNILNNLITENNENGILFGENVSNTLINQNNISSNKNIGINLLNSCDNVTIKGNTITLNYNVNTNEGNGIYINTTISGLNITSNFIFKNGKVGICNDLGVTELVNGTQSIDYNYITGHTLRDVVRFVYNDEFDVVRAPVWIGETCFGGFKRLCPSAQLSGDAVMSKILQISDGIYQVSFINNKTGLTSTDFGSFYVTFFLNKNDTSKGSADIGDVWKEILVENGIATVDFSNYTYKPTNNTVFTIAPYIGFKDALKDYLIVNDSDIPSSKFNLSAYSSASKTSLKNGDTIIYKLTIKNNNKKDASAVKVTNILSPTFYTSSAKSPRGHYSNGVWNVGTLKAGETLTISISAKAKKSGITKSQAKISGSNINILYSNTIQRTINKYIKLSYKNYVSSSKVKRNRNVLLTSKVSNSGKDKSSTVKVKINLPKGIKLVSVNYPSVYNKKTKIWTVNVPAGKAYSLKLKAKVTSKGTKKVIFNINGKIQNRYIKVY